LSEANFFGEHAESADSSGEPTVIVCECGYLKGD
jgi:hypothetical protein